MTLQPGDSVGPYEVRERLGEGGMATVYRAWHGGLHRDEALKVPHGGNADSAYVQRLLNEARMAAGLRHANVVAIHSVSDPGAPLPYFAMEWIEGEDLSAWLKERGRLHLQETVQLLEPVAAALDYAHARGVIHRDIKPANILLQQEGGSAPTPKVVDFGISRAAGDDDGATRLTRGGMFVGTPEYMSPEQSGSGEEVGPSTDVYSLGVVAYELLCGRPPFTVGSGVSRLAILVAHVREAPVPPSRVVPGLPTSADDAILRALAKQQDERFATCVEFVAALRDALADAVPVAVNGDGVVADVEAAEFPDVATLLGRPLPTAAGGAATRPMAAPATHKVQEPVVPEPAATMTGPAPVPLAPQPKKSYLPVLAGAGGLLAGVAIMLGFALMKPNSEPAAIAPPPAKPAAQKLSATVPTASVRKLKQIRAIPFRTEYRNTPYLPAGSKKTVRYGKSGQREVVLEIQRKGNKELSRKVISQRVLRAPQSQVTLIGTRRAAPTRRQPVYRAPAPVYKGLVKRVPKPVWKPVARPKPKPKPVWHPAPKPVYRPKPAQPPVWAPAHGRKKKQGDDLERAMKRVKDLRDFQREVERSLRGGVRMNGGGRYWGH